MNISFLKLFLTLALFFCTSAFILNAQESKQDADPEIIKIQEYSDLQMTELTLKNGMRVIIKPTDDDSEICIRLAALGGYASRSPLERASGELSANIVMESGIGDFCADKLSAYLYAHSIEFNLKIEPYARSIDASLPEESLDAFFGLVNKTFTAPKFSPEAFIAVLSKKRSELARKGNETSIDDILNLVSVQEKHALHPLTAKDLDQANFNKAKQFFLSVFSNPADFVCIIAGNIDVDATKKLAIQYLSTIPSQKTDQKFVLPSHSKAPKTIATKTQNLPYSNESLVRLALPLQMTLDNIKLEHLELICQMIENRLRNMVKNHSYDAKGVDVWYELPLYPSLEHPWMTIQFHVDNNHIRPTIDLVLEELRKVCQKGLSPEEVKLAIKLKKQSLQLWEHDNDYWIVMLANHYLWNWDPHRIAEKFKNPVIVDPKAIHSTIQAALLMDDYTFSVQP